MCGIVEAMKVVYSLSIFRAAPEDIEAAREIADNMVVTTSGEWHRISWFRVLSAASLSQDIVTLLGQRQAEALTARFEEAGLLSSKLVTLFTAVEGLSDYRTLFR
jgi:H2-forming N5,N10-methylenetetrahydromethanopterin dehydrogenase-like enzyme